MTWGHCNDIMSSTDLKRVVRGAEAAQPLCWEREHSALTSASAGAGSGLW